jgi:hypothetical protein
MTENESYPTDLLIRDYEVMIAADQRHIREDRTMGLHERAQLVEAVIENQAQLRKLRGE